jgi:hypothetical protein
MLAGVDEMVHWRAAAVPHEHVITDVVPGVLDGLQLTLEVIEDDPRPFPLAGLVEFASPATVADEAVDVFQNMVGTALYGARVKRNQQICSASEREPRDRVEMNVPPPRIDEDEDQRVRRHPLRYVGRGLVAVQA